MFIRKIVIEGVECDVEIERDGWETVVRGEGLDIRLAADADRDTKHRAAYDAARLICGTTKTGEPNATRSMIHDVLCEIERVTDR